MESQTKQPEERGSRCRRAYLAGELCTLFVAVPLLLYVYRHHVGRMVVPTILLVVVPCLALLLTDPTFDRRRLWNTEELWPRLRRTLVFFLPAALALALVYALFEPERLFAFPRRNPGFWLVVMALYPLVSVYPQELIFRTFLFHRYRALVPSTNAMILLSGVLFGLAHLFFDNWIAPVLSTAGGILFARTYARTGSTLQASLEHGLWGDFLFTLGIGWYFYGGSIQ
ncbi:MAG: CPBP family intramembrane glutamic endopeptidase [Acidobacteriota bacterium]